jgi:prepilin-type N-terminal cleavage/methylation domain-containing protein
MKRQQSGFTLVEIAIVLVIIGLLLGGILKGQEMINQAKIKNVVSDFNGIASALYGYQDRYRQLPGDDTNAVTRWTQSALVACGTQQGDGIIEGVYNSPASAVAESNCFWQDLRNAGFVAGQGSGQSSLLQPTNAASGMIGVQTGSGLSPPTPVMQPAGGGGFSSLMMCSTGLPDKIAIAVDVQMDDGVNSSGTMRGQLQTTPNPPINAALTAGDAYVETGSNTYTICKTM